MVYEDMTIVQTQTLISTATATQTDTVTDTATATQVQEVADTALASCLSSVRLSAVILSTTNSEAVCEPSARATTG